jgi:hypothetical protein
MGDNKINISVAIKGADKARTDLDGVAAGVKGVGTTAEQISRQTSAAADGLAKAGAVAGQAGADVADGADKAGQCLLNQAAVAV